MYFPCHLPSQGSLLTPRRLDTSEALLEVCLPSRYRWETPSPYSFLCSLQPCSSSYLSRSPITLLIPGLLDSSFRKLSYLQFCTNWILAEISIYLNELIGMSVYIDTARPHRRAVVGLLTPRTPGEIVHHCGQVHTVADCMEGTGSGA
jgi:hypothetical protein